MYLSKNIKCNSIKKQKFSYYWHFLTAWENCISQFFKIQIRLDRI